MDPRCTDPVVWNDWFAISPLEELRAGRYRTTVLLGVPVAVAKLADGGCAAWDNTGGSARSDAPVAETPVGRPLALVARFGFAWVCLGEPARPLFDLPEAREPDRRCCNAGSIGVHVGGLRAVENFLDMAHFPFVHTGILGEEDDTAVLDYKVSMSPETGVLATECRFHQPRASRIAQGAIETQYVYHVLRPFCVVLYKTSTLHPDRMDVIALFVQPVGEEECIAHQWLCLLDDESSDGDLRQFQLTIFGQDRPVLESHVLKRLPLDPRMEMPVRADASSVAYRRWLRMQGLVYSTIPAAA